MFSFRTLPESVGYSIEKKNRKAVQKWIKRNELLSCKKLNYDLDMIMEKTEKIATSSSPTPQNRLTIFEMIREILSDREITRRIIVETFLWILTFMTYCALSLTSTSVGNSDPLVSFLFSGVVELPAYLFIPICLTRLVVLPWGALAESRKFFWGKFRYPSVYTFLRTQKIRIFQVAKLTE